MAFFSCGRSLYRAPGTSVIGIPSRRSEFGALHEEGIGGISATHGRTWNEADRHDGVRVEFSVPRSDSYVLWAELRPKSVPRGQAMRVELDRRKATWRPTWDFVCRGHGDPNPVPFFDTVKQSSTGNRAEPRSGLEAGKHVLRLVLPNGQCELVSLTVTNDHGYVPEGITSFLAERVK